MADMSIKNNNTNIYFLHIFCISGIYSVHIQNIKYLITPNVQ